jgi:hypothetical protein
MAFVGSPREVQTTIQTFLDANISREGIRLVKPESITQMPVI